MSACHDFEPILLDRASGALDPAAASRLEAHLTGCAACRAEAAALDRTLSLVRLPPPSPLEERALDGLADSLRAAQARSRARRAWPARIAVPLAVAAAAVAFLVAPAYSRRAPHLTPEEVARAIAAQTPAWQEPDTASLWEATAVLDDEGSSDLASADEVVLETVAFDQL
jgi:anti-sigma factor RsiW